MRPWVIYSLMMATLFMACSSKYQAFESRYRFNSSNGSPDYSQLDYWAAHPWKADPGDSIPAPLAHEKRDSLADVFFLHPTSFTTARHRQKLNADIDDPAVNAKTDYTSILYQASAFNQHSRVFAPRYRQSHIRLFYKSENGNAEKAQAIAYADVRAAFLHYVKSWNNGRPIIIAAHSQGSMLANRLLKEFFDVPPDSMLPELKNKLLVAYVVGWPVPKDYFSRLGMCRDSLETSCLCSWRTFKRGYTPSFLKNNGTPAFATNPLNWTTGNEYAGRKLNKGSVLYKFNKIYPHSTDAQVQDGLLFVHKPKFPWSFLYFRRNYHIADINLFYMNVRHNVEQRIRAWKDAHKH